MDVNKIIKEHHQAMIHKGFYDCPECLKKPAILVENEPTVCSLCNGTRIDPNKNIGELLMLIVSELGEALEAHRKGRFAPKELDMTSMIECFNSDKHEYTKEAIKLFKIAYKDTFEDEIADVFLRLFDLCGYLGIEPEWDIEYCSMLCDEKNIGAGLLSIVSTLIEADKVNLENDIRYSFATLQHFCNNHKIHIEKHIEAKMAYNKTRPYKHGKKY